MTFNPKALFAPNEVGVLCISSKPEALRLAHVIAEFDDADESLPMEMLVLIHDELRRLHSVNQELVEALEAYLPFIPITSAKEGGASAFSENVRAADMFRAALAKATGGQA